MTKVAKYRSGFEAKIAKNSPKNVEYETVKIAWMPPIKTYTPDFILPNGIILEAKGRFLGSDRTKMKCVIEQHPDMDIRMLFMNPRIKITKGSKTTYADWCNKNGIQWAEGDRIPEKWLKEKKKK